MKQPMTRVILKYPINPKSPFVIAMPVDSKILTVQMQDGNPQMWVLAPADKGDLFKERHFFLVATGVPFEMDDFDEYLGTFQVQEGRSLVFHLFERLPQ